jgi:hypothetical protein
MRAPTRSFTRAESRIVVPIGLTGLTLSCERLQAAAAERHGSCRNDADAAMSELQLP